MHSFMYVCMYVCDLGMSWQIKHVTVGADDDGYMMLEKL